MAHPLSLFNATKINKDRVCNSNVKYNESQFLAEIKSKELKVTINIKTGPDEERPDGSDLRFPAPSVCPFGPGPPVPTERGHAPMGPPGGA